MKVNGIVLGALSISSMAAAQVRNPAVPVLRADSSHAVAGATAVKGVANPAGGVQVVSQQSQAQLVNGSDDCSTADLIAGPGAFTYDTTLAITGMNGQLNTGIPAGTPSCTSSNQTGIAKDVWFLWTSTATGRVDISTCDGSNNDTKMAVYDWAAIGSTCPLNNQASTVVACNDDISVIKLPSRCLFNAVQGNQYLIQLGEYPVTPTGLAGTFTIDYLPIPDASPCQDDDGSPEVVFAYQAPFTSPNGEQAILQSQGLPGDNTIVSNILVAYGATFNAVNSVLVDGTPVNVYIWDDPNDDFNPADAVLLQTVATTIQNHDTNILNVVPLAPAVNVTGVYFIGWSLQVPFPVPAGNGWLPYPFDLQGCEALLGDDLVFWNVGAPLNPNNLGAGVGPANSQPAAIPNISFNNGISNILTTNTAYLLRPDCLLVTAGTPFCFGDGAQLDHTTPCPCGNFGAVGNGCAHSFNAAGANLTASGNSLSDTVQLFSSGEPATSFTLFMQHDAPGDSVFHDGTLCAGGTLIRLRGRAAGIAPLNPGEATFPNPAFDASITLSQRGSVILGSGAVRFYAAWFRNASTTFCPPATANVTNGWTITW